MASYDIDNEKKDIVGIGKIILHTRTVSWNVPHLHFIVCRVSGYFEAICLEFGLVSTGETQEESAKRLVEHTIYHIGSVINKGDGFEEFKEVALNGFMNGYWGAYRHIEFCLAETKQDLSHEFESHIESRITRELQVLFEEKIKAFISSIAQIPTDEAIKEYEKLSAFNLNSVRYSQLEAAA